MAGKVHQLWDLELAKSSLEEESWCHHNLKKAQDRSHDLLLWKEPFRDPLHMLDDSCSKAYPHKFTNYSLWIDSSHNSSCVVDQLNRRGNAQLPEKNENKALLSNDEASAFAALVKACAKNKDLHRGTKLHDEISKRGLLKKYSDALVIMYAKCGALAKANEVLDMHQSRDVFSWTAVIAGYARHGQNQVALKCFEQMERKSLSPDAVTYACILRACGNIGAIHKGEQIHDKIAKKGLLGNNIVLGTALMDMYAKCGALAKAQQVHEELPFRDVVSWSALIAGYVQQGQGEEALKCFEQMQGEGLCPDAITFSCILKACGTIGAIEKGEQIHDEIARQGLLTVNIVLGNALVDMYVKCNALTKARRVLEELPCRDIVSWNSLITGYAQHGEGEQALNCFECMQREGLSPDVVTFTSMLKACGTIKAADKGKQIHDEIARQGLLGNDVVLGTALVDMYVKCGDIANAQHILEELPSRSVISWNALITGYMEQGQSEKAWKCFEQLQDEGLSPDAVTFACILKACGNIGDKEKGERIHDQIKRHRSLRNNVVLGTALVDMYAKCGALKTAQQVLEDLPSRDVISWSTLITGYAEQGQGEQALNCFEKMQREGLCPDAVTFACILKACRTIGAVDKGEQIHDKIARQGLLGDNMVLGTTLLDMYASCGAPAKAHRVLEELPSRDVVTWNTLIAGYAQQGLGEQALRCFEQMQHEGFAPNGVTFLCVLNVCSHLGLVEDGHMYFMNMSTKYGVKPGLEHYTCMVDLFGRAGHLDKAVGVIQETESLDCFAIWSALLAACQKWGNVSVGRWAFERAVQVDKNVAASYVLMANIYTTAGMQQDAEKIEAMRMENKAWNKQGQG